MTDALVLGYCLGLIVGEGSFTVQGQSRSPVLKVGLHIDDPLPLHALQNCFGGSVTGPYFSKGREWLEWRLSGVELLEAMPILDQHLPRSRKREQYEDWLKSLAMADLISHHKWYV